MDAAVARFELHIPVSRSLKAKRAALKPLVEDLRQRFRVSVAEVDHQNAWQRTAIAVAVVAPDHTQVQAVLDEVERFVAGAPEADLLETQVTWFEPD